MKNKITKIKRVRFMALLEVKGLTKRFKGLMAVKDVSFAVDKGECVGIIGPNGAGKTTIFNLITGFLRPEDGAIFFKGEDITNLEPYEIVNKGIARTFQLVSPFSNMSVLENVLVPLYIKRKKLGEALENRALEILKLTGLLYQKDKIAKSLPHGDLKKLEIARALATEPEILLLDEPFAGLSFDEMSVLMGVIKKLHENGLTVVIVEHVMRVIMKLSERVIVISEGQKIAEGKPLEITENRKVIEAYLGGGYSCLR
ncbi:MAG: ABC transporter ATP-binding protein [Candidatus Bathyarchaeia archaeon]